MRYWGFLAAKLIVASSIVWGLWRLLYRLLPPPQTFMSHRVSRFGQDLPWTLVSFALFLFACGLLAAVLLDQKYRCRTCLRRLRMPVMAGSWPNSFLRGAPKIEYICPYGHGTLGVPELQIAGREVASWRENEDLWTELERQNGSG
ncbi:MAG: hypothetical protein SFV54_24630 [Bryobacteraceae bacterium]|nr:hypothetical protein [Bryobacteraceae bacterium]